MEQNMLDMLEQQSYANIRAFGTLREYQPGEIIFSEGDLADCVYFIESGRVSIFLHEFTNRVEIGQRSHGSFFGEMAVISQGHRTASVSALTSTTLVVLDREQFRKLMDTDQAVNELIGRVIAQRTKELALKENLLSATGIKGNRLQISIKGDPSMRETAFDRERRESPMDKVLPQLVPQLLSLLVERNVNEISLHFNSGEIRLTSVFDPFNYEIHPANKLIDSSYLDRHFPVMDFNVKVSLIRGLYDTLATQLNNLPMPNHYKECCLRRYREWQPLAKKEIAHVINKLQTLRTIPNFYLRNMGISITRDAIRMQFNCDGTYIISTGEYDQFFADNLGIKCTI